MLRLGHVQPSSVSKATDGMAEKYEGFALRLTLHFSRMIYRQTDPFSSCGFPCP